MKNKILKTSSFFATVIALFASASVILSCKTEPEPQDTTAPQDVTELSAEPRDSAVLLSWRDAEDSDIFGYEISYARTSEIADEAESRAAVELEKNNIYVSKGTQRFYAAGLTNETEYTFTIKSVDTSGNKSKGASVKASPNTDGWPLKIALEKPADVSNTEITVTAKITSLSSIKRVVYKKDGDREAKVLLADEDALEATQDPDDNTKWTFTLDATKVNNESLNGLYTVAAIDSAGREETKQIPVYNFDFTEPEAFTVYFDYNAKTKTFIAKWSVPKDTNEGKNDYIVSGFKDMTVSYKKKGDGAAIETNTFTSETTSFTPTLEENQSYEFTFTAQDNFGNKIDQLCYKKTVSPDSYNVGDIILADGTNVAASDFSLDKDNPPVAIFAVFEWRTKIGIGLHFSPKLAFAPKGTPGYSTKFENIICTPKTNIVLGEAIPTNTTTFDGDKIDGSDNWKEICKADPTAEANAETNYPAFWWANNYGLTYFEKLGGVTGGWYIPTNHNLYYIYYKNRETIETSLKKIYQTYNGYADSATLPNASMSSSQSENSANSCWFISGSKPSSTKLYSFLKSTTSYGTIVAIKFADYSDYD